MTLRELFVRKGLASSVHQESVCCPFHGDRTPSATLYANSLKCWSKCQRSYQLLDFSMLWGAEAAGLVVDPTPDYLPEEEGNEKVVMFVGPAE